MNTKFGKLENGKLNYAPTGLVIDGALVINPKAADYAACGWLPLVTDNQPTDALGVTYAPTGWEERDGAIYRTWTSQPIVAPVRTWTPLSIKRACSDKWADVKAALVASDLYEDFCMAQYLASDDAAFQQGYAWAVSQYGAEAVNSILDAAEAM